MSKSLSVMHYKIIIQTNKNGEFAGHIQIEQAKNRLTSVQHSKWAH